MNINLTIGNEPLKRRKNFSLLQNRKKLTLPVKFDANTKKINYERLVQVLLERLPNIDRTKVDELIREVRRRKNGIGGLTMREIVVEAKAIRYEKTRPISVSHRYRPDYPPKRILKDFRPGTTPTHPAKTIL